MKRKVAMTITFLLIALFLTASVNIGLAQADYTITTAQAPDIGKYLVDGQGKTLYYFTKDTSGVSNCKGQCASLWPAFYAEKIIVSEGLDAAEFGVITRDDGMKQTTFRGWPLYYFSKDLTAGDIKGQEFNGVWFIIKVKE